MKTLAILLLLAPRIVHNSMGGDLDVNYAPNGATLRTMGGDIRVARSNDLVVARTMGGNIRVRQLEGSLDAGTMGGQVDIEVVGGGTGRTIEASSMGGTVELTVPKDFAAEYWIRLEIDKNDREEGRIVSDVPLHIEEERGHRWFKTVRIVTGTATSGAAANHVRLKTYGGDIVIRTR